MKAAAVILLIAFASVECRKIVQVSKHANVDFINMESGGGYQPPQAPTPAPVAPKSPVQPAQPSPLAPVKPAVTTTKPLPAPPVTPSVSKPVQPQQPKPNQGVPTQLDLRPVQGGKPAGGAATTPGYGNVKQLVTFYDSHGNASVIRPYSYSDAVKKGK